MSLVGGILGVAKVDFDYTGIAKNQMVGGVLSMAR